MVYSSHLPVPIGPFGIDYPIGSPIAYVPCLITDGHPWISTDVHGYPWTSMDIHGSRKPASQRGIDWGALAINLNISIQRDLIRLPHMSRHETGHRK